MSNLYAVDNYFTFQVNLRYFLFLVNQEDHWAATEICNQIFGIRMVYRETFLQMHKRLRQLILECSIQRIFFYGKYSGASKYGETRNRKWWSRPQPILSQNGSNPTQFLNFQF